jgi:hypothetical protein
MADSPTPAWRPLLAGREARRAVAVAQEIAAALRGAPPAGSAGLTGEAGIALLYAYLDRALPGRGHGDVALELLGREMERMAEPGVAPGLFAGFAGVAWAIEHLTGHLIDPTDDPAGEVAEVVADLLARSPWPRELDLMSGLVGFGVYGRERLPRPWGRECLERAVAQLAATAEERPAGIAWRSRPEWLPAPTRATYPEGNSNLGLAHGQPAAIALLARAADLGVAAETARGLLPRAVAYLLSNRLPPGGRSAFPAVDAPGRAPIPARLAWCYGDLAVASALLAAGRLGGEPAWRAWEEEARGLARAAALRDEGSAGARDACLCHGTAGIAHLFNRLHHATGDEALAAAARAWYARTLAERRPGEGIAGFRFQGMDAAGEETWCDDPGLLDGAAGVALALLAAATPIEPEWDRVMLLS